MLNSVLISIISVAVILGFMILIHEFGHYAVAKLLGVRVEQFAIGFGKRLVGFRKGETDYRIIKQFFARHSDTYDAQFRFGRSNPRIRDRVNAMNGMLCNADGQRRFLARGHLGDGPIHRRRPHAVSRA